MTRRAALSAVLLALLFAALAAAFRPAAFAQDDGTFDIAVREGATLLDPGRPVADAVAAWVDDGWSTKEAAAVAVRADAAGRIRMPFAGEGGRVLVWAPGRAPVGLRVGKPLPFDVVLTAASSPEIRVTTAAGAPVGDADVVAEALVPLQRSAEVHVYRTAGRTDGAGRLVLAEVPDVPFSVTAHADGFVDGTVFPVDPRRGASVTLGRGSRVAGTLLLAPGGLPGKGATARLGPRTAKVGDDGTFAFETVPPGPWELSFSGPGFAPPAVRTLVLRDGDDRLGIDVVAPRSSELRGHVTAPDGAAVPAIRATLVYPPDVSAAPREAFAVVGIDGTFSLRDLPPADGVALRIESPGWVPVRVEGVSLPSGAASHVVEVTFAPGAGLTGVLLDLEGRPISGAAVFAAAAEPPNASRDTGRTTTDADGRFAFDGLPPGRAWVRLVGRPVGSGTNVGPFPVKAGETTDAGEHRVFAGWTIDGRVPGAPDGTTVVASAAAAGAAGGADVARATVVAGAFTLPGLPAGLFDLRAESGGDVVGTARASLPAAWTVTIAYEPAVLLRGRVTDATGRPLADVSVEATGIERGGLRRVRVGDPAGGFEMRLPRGRWRVEASRGDGGGGTTIGSAVDVTLPRDAERQIVLTMAAGSTIRGVVTGADDAKLLEGVLVQVFAVGDERRLASTRSDAEGRFAVRGVPPSIVRIRFDAPDRGALATAPRPIREADELDLGVVALPGGVVARVEAFTAGSSVLARGEVRIQCDGGTVRMATTDEYGRAVVPGLAPGGAILRVRDEGGAVLRTSRIVVPDAAGDWPLRIDCGSGTRVAGRITTGGREEPFARVALRLLAPQAAEATTVADEQGRYALPPMPPGTGEIEVSAAGAASPWRRAVRIAQGVEQTVDVALPEQSVSGVVVAALGGDPVPGATVELRIAEDMRPVASGTSIGSGTFELRRVPAGSYDLVVRRDGFGPAVVRGVAVAAGRNTTDVRVVLPAEGRLTLRVLDDRGRPVSNAWATARQAAQPDRPRGGAERVRRTEPGDAATDAAVTAWAAADGSISLVGLSAGAWRIVVGAHGAGRTDLGTVRVGEGEARLPDVTLPRGAALRILVVTKGVPRAGVPVNVSDVYAANPRPPRRLDDPLLGPDGAYVSGPDGIVEISGLAAGRYYVGIPESVGRAEVQRVQIGAETVETVILSVTDAR